VDFLVVYISEAHPGSIVSVPKQGGGSELQIIPPTSNVEERLRNLRQFVEVVGLTIPSVIDGEDDAVKRAYAAWPDRIYVVGVDGKIAYKGAPGPTGFKVPDLAAWLRENAK
jgi:hypothetical protein